LIIITISIITISIVTAILFLLAVARAVIFTVIRIIAAITLSFHLSKCHRHALWYFWWR
jgi:hypothetical protein